MSYGVGITTRNRTSSLKASLEHFLAFPSAVDKYVIVDDASSPEFDCSEIVDWFRNQVDAEVVLRRSSNRMGIAKAKNACLYPLQDMDHVFLFDDDSWPMVEGWAHKWSNATDAHGIHHSMVIAEILDRYGKPIYSVTNTIGSGDTAINGWSNCLGCVLHFTNKAITTVGGYDEANAKNVYGYEHAQMSKRCRDAGLTSGIMYPSPRDVYNWIYCVDIHWQWYKTLPPLEVPDKKFFRSSVTPEEARLSSLNAKMMQTSSIYVPLVDPMYDQSCHH